MGRTDSNMTYSLFNDRRRFFRRPYKGQVSLKLGEVIKGNGTVKDIGTGGVCVVSKDPFAFYRPEQADVLLEKSMLVSLPEESLVIKGTIVRIDTVKNELAIAITHTSDNARWRVLSR
jgi:hypothetical protein